MGGSVGTPRSSTTPTSAIICSQRSRPAGWRISSKSMVGRQPTLPDGVLVTRRRSTGVWTLWRRNETGNSDRWYSSFQSMYTKRSSELTPTRWTLYDGARSTGRISFCPLKGCRQAEHWQLWRSHTAWNRPTSPPSTLNVTNRPSVDVSVCATLAAFVWPPSPTTCSSAAFLDVLSPAVVDVNRNRWRVSGEMQ